MTLPRSKDWLWPFSGKLLGFWRMLSHGVLLTDGDGNPPNVADLNMVAPLEAAYNEAEGRMDLSIAAAALIPDVPTNRTVWLDVINGDDLTGEAGQQTKPFATMAASIAAASGLLPTAASPALIKVHPGTVTAAPFTVPSYVTISSTDGAETVLIQASTATAALITMNPTSRLNGCTVLGADGVGGVGILVNAALSSPTQRPVVERVVVRDCTTAIRCTGSSAQLRLFGCDVFRLAGETLDTGVEALAGAIILARSVNVEGASGYEVTKAFVASGSNSRMLLAEANVSFCDDALYVESGGNLVTASNGIAFCKYGLHIAASGGSMQIGATTIESSIVEDILVESSAASLLLNGVLVERKPSIASGATVFGVRLDRVNNEQITDGNVRHGDPVRPASVSIGSGGLHNSGFRAFWNTNVEAGTWTDVTDIWLSPSGSAVDLVPGLGVGNSAFIGSDSPLPGIWWNVLTARVGGTIVPKYWNGAAWTAIPRWMTTQAVSPYESTANALFTATGQQNQRYSAMTGDTAKTVNGVLKYWYLFEVTSALTTAPRIEQVRLQSNSLAVNSDGFVEFFGIKQPRSVLPAGDVLPIDWQPSGIAPAAVNVAVSTNIIYPSYGFNDAQVRQINRALGVPWGLNTAEPLYLDVEWAPAGTNTGNVRWNVYYAIFATNAVLAAALPGPISESTSTVLSAGPGVAYRGVVASHTLTIPSALPGYTLALQVQRDGTAGDDTFTDQARLRSIRLRGTFWAHGRPSR